MNVTKTDLIEQQKTAELVTVLDGLDAAIQARLIDWLNTVYVKADA